MTTRELSQQLIALRRHHPAWLLLAARNGPLILASLKALLRSHPGGIQFETAAEHLAASFANHANDAEFELGDEVRRSHSLRDSQTHSKTIACPRTPAQTSKIAAAPRRAAALASAAHFGRRRSARSSRDGRFLVVLAGRSRAHDAPPASSDVGGQRFIERRDARRRRFRLRFRPAGRTRANRRDRPAPATPKDRRPVPAQGRRSRR